MNTVKTKPKASAEAVVSEPRPILSAMFAPKSLALIGASEKPGSVGRALLENLQSFRGRVFPINPNHARLLGQKAFPTIRDVSEDLILPLSQYRGRPSRQLSPDNPRKPAHIEANVRNGPYVGGSVPKTTRTS